MNAIRPCTEAHLDAAAAIISAAATVYAGVIPANRYHVPFMPLDELRGEVAAEKDRLLRRYRQIPERQVETSVVLRHDAARGLNEARGRGREWMAGVRQHPRRSSRLV